MRVAVKSERTLQPLCVTDGASVAGGRPGAASLRLRRFRSVETCVFHVALCPAGKDNDGFNEGPLNHVTIDLAKT